MIGAAPSFPRDMEAPHAAIRNLHSTTYAMPALAYPAAPTATSLTPALFVALSSGLTGVSAARLKPADDPANTAGRHYASVIDHVPAATLERIVAVFLAAPTAADGAAAILEDPELASVGHGIIKLWLPGHSSERSRRGAPGHTNAGFQPASEITG